MRQARLLPPLAVLMLSTAGPTLAGPPLQPSELPAWREDARLDPTGDALGDEGDAYGTSVAADGDTVAIGVPGHGLPTSEAGCVYVYERTGATWTPTAKLTPPAPVGPRRFGARVALEGDTLAVASEPAWGPGPVYVYLRQGGTWTLQAALAAPVQAGAFGRSLALSGDTLVVGAPEASTGFGSRSGAVFVYTRVAGTWSLEQGVLGFEIAGDDNFGRAVALEGDTLAVGAPYDDTGTALDAGSVYVFERSGGSWNQAVKLTDPAGGESFQFGTAVAFESGTIVVGAPNQGDGRVHVYENVAGVFLPRALLASATGQERFGGALALRGGRLVVGFDTGYWGTAGAAEVFVGSGSAWGPGAPLVPAGLEPGDACGSAVAVGSGTAVVGSPGRIGTGAAWIWEESGASWTIQAQLDNPGTTRGDAFGSAVALESTTLVVGAPDDDTAAGRNSGAVYIFERVGTAWELKQKLLPPSGMEGQYAGDGPRFGTSLALAGNRLAVGAPHARQDGRVLVFTRTAGTWALAAELEPSDPALYVYPSFGAAVALRGPWLLVGAPLAQAEGRMVGAVYAFEEAAGAWMPRQKVVPVATSSGFGATVAADPSGATALVGAPEAESASVLTLAAGTWRETQRLSPDDPLESGEFGRAAAASGTDAFIGAPGTRRDHYFGVGAVQVFRPAGGLWAPVQRLEPASEGYNQRFGAALAVDGPLLTVGAPGGDFLDGTVHVFENVDGTWTWTATLEGGFAGVESRFGTAVAVSEGRVVVGQPAAGSTAIDAGAAHVFAAAASDLGIVLAAPPSVPQGRLVTIDVTLTNSGPDTIAGASFRVTFGSGLVPPDVPWDLASSTSCSSAGAVVSCSVPSLPVGTTLVASITRVAVTAGTSSILAEVGSVDANPANDTATLGIDVTPSTADVSLSVSGPAYARVGGRLSYSLQLFNAGPGSAAGLEVEMPTPPGLVRVSVSGCDANDCRIARLDLTATSWIQVDYDVPASYSGPVPIAFSGTVTTASLDPEPANNQAAHATAFVPPPTPLDYYTLTPCRLYDSRLPGEAALLPGQLRIVQPGGRCGVSYGARALAVNVTVTGPTASGNVRLYPAYSPVPNVSTVNYATGQTRANNAIVTLSPEGDLAVLATQAGGAVHVVVDVAGYYE